MNHTLLHHLKMCIPSELGRLTKFNMLSTAQLQEQRDILKLLYRATGGEMWTKKENWNDDSKPVSSFFGVTVDRSSGAVVALDLEDNGLSGKNRPNLVHPHNHLSTVHVTILCDGVRFVFVALHIFYT